MWGILDKEVSVQEVQEALWSIKNDKSPGPDGFNSFFFKKSWSIVGPNIIAAIKDYFRNGLC